MQYADLDAPLLEEWCSMQTWMRLCWEEGFIVLTWMCLCWRRGAVCRPGCASVGGGVQYADLNVPLLEEVKPDEKKLR